jgi:adenine-specific DNA-methyltransferase
MNSADSYLQKFQQLLRELFQFDCQGLDFGIYRVLNYKRKQIEEFIDERLPRIVAEAFARYAAADRTTAERELEEKRHELVSTLGVAALDSAGQLAPEFRNTPLGKQFLELEQKAKAWQIADVLQASVYNDLYTFFSRYYEDGDIFSKPRRGKVEIPFTGDEDVVLHWANRDQYYIKTGEQFKSYRFRAGTFAVEFALRNVSTERNNDQREKRYFVLAQESAVTFDSKTGALKVLLEYRPLSNREKIAYGKTEQQKPQDKLNVDAETAILDRVKEATLKAHLAKPRGEDRPSLLLHHLTRFTRRNTTDFFIHKDLRGFLARELEDFLKTEVIRTAELLAAEHPDVSRRALLRAQVVRRIAGHVIEFLAQVEDFQKKLFEKRKFVVRTEYCITLDRLPEALWDEVLKNKAQMEEWRRLYALDDLLKAGGLFNRGLTKEFLHKHPHLVVDTRHFPEEFKWRLLAAFDDLETALDGLLIKSENFQGLALLLARYRERVKCTYIDPPYNSKSTEILYRNFYKHSSWLCLMDNRLAMSRYFSTQDGTHIVAIDENEQERLGLLLSAIFPEYVKVCVAIVHNKKGIQGDYFSYNHDYAFFCIPPGLKATNQKPIPPSEWEYDNLRKWGKESERSTAKNCFYPILVKGGGIVGFGEVSPESFHPGTSNRKRRDGTVEVYPVDSEGEERKWRYARDSVEGIKHLLKVHITNTDEIQIVKAKDSIQYKTVWDDPIYIAGDYGTRLLTEMGISPEQDIFPKSLHTVCDSIHAVSDGKSVVLDYFAGSGTTGHAVIELNRREGRNGDRKYLLVETGDWFENVMLVRMKKAIFCESWKGGKPNRGIGVSHFLKYQVLEQYEDALYNLELPREKEGELALRAFGDEYLLRYMLEFETQNSPSLLALDHLRHPFAYKLKVLDGDETVERTVDLVETFNYLLGLDVKKLREMRDGQRVYRAVLGQSRKGENVVIIWRDLDGVEDNKEALQKDRDFIESKVLPALLGKEKKSVRLLINGECVVEGAEAIEPEFYRLMFAPIA